MVGSKRDFRRRRFLSSQSQEAAKQELYYKDYRPEWRIDPDKVEDLGLTITHTSKRLENGNIELSKPKFHFRGKVIPAKNWEEAITWHFHNIYMKGE